MNIIKALKLSIKRFILEQQNYVEIMEICNNLQDKINDYEIREWAEEKLKKHNETLMDVIIVKDKRINALLNQIGELRG